ncbi:hypothetical protein NEOLEDRAFT_1131889 [Neolentinus lepideus HHB14362 ss-1]|uniref:Uncharacterized protein n=1 Tax=Neolentinus lepideus HHB14362 ss-1 TaxID=1314782 RepID=A0A165TL28_9AGAM|nr:hypothetical protein NEOLEDRAFT_1131889 [Neolentinus lepideus HHB14362 ss-1]
MRFRVHVTYAIPTVALPSLRGSQGHTVTRRTCTKPSPSRVWDSLRRSLLPAFVRPLAATNPRPGESSAWKERLPWAAL